MFNPEKLLGGLLRSGKRGRSSGLGSLATGGAALGVVGVAMAAAEHYLNKRSTTSGNQSGTPPQPSGATSVAPPRTAPPPPPPSQAAPAPSSPLPADSGISARQSDAVLLIRAMIAAANADGVIDADERANILGKLKSIDLTTEENEFIVHELLSPKPVQELLDQVKSPEMARQVYVASLLAINVDTEKERDYMRMLSRQLGLNDSAVDEIHQQLAVPMP